MSGRRSIFRASAMFSAAALIESVGSMLFGFSVARCLGPVLQGVWQTAMLVRNYADMAVLGQGSGMLRQVAVALGAGDRAEVEVQRRTGFAWHLLLMSLAGAFVGCWALLWEQDPSLKRALLAVATVLAVQGVSSFLNMWFKACSRFGALSILSAVAGGAYLTGVLFVAFWGFAGLTTAYVLIQVLIACASLLMDHEKLRPGFSFGAWIRSMRTGGPLFLVGVSALLFMTVDRAVVIGALGFSDMGFYSVASMFFFPIQTLLASAAVVLAPAAYEHYGAHGREGIERFFVEPLLVFLSVLPLASVLLRAALPLAVDLLLPSYHPGIVPAQIVLLGLPFAGTAAFCHNVIVASGKTWWLVVIAVVSSIAKAFLLWLLLKAGWALPGVAVATTISYGIYFVLMFWCAWGCVSLANTQWRRVLIVSVWAILTAALVAILFRDVRDALSMEWLKSNGWLAFLACGLACGPVAWGVGRLWKIMHSSRRDHHAGEDSL